jgi:hypothetical protein
VIGCKLTNDLQSAARQAALREGAEFEIHLVEGEEIDAIVRFLADYKADLLGIGRFIITSRTYHIFGARFTHLHRMLPAAFLVSIEFRPRKIAVSTSRVDAMGE